MFPTEECTPRAGADQDAGLRPDALHESEHPVSHRVNMTCKAVKLRGENRRKST